MIYEQADHNAQQDVDHTALVERVAVVEVEQKIIKDDIAAIKELLEKAGL